LPRILDAPLTAYILPAFLLLTAIGFLLLAGTFDLQSRMIPLLIGRTMFALATLDLLSRARTHWGQALLKWLNPAALKAQVPGEYKQTYRTELAYILWITVFAACLIWFGVFVSTPLFLLASLKLGGRRTLTESILVTLAVCAFVWTLFTLVLHLQLFPGLLFGGAW
jgi:hypothetical protein